MPEIQNIPLHQLTLLDSNPRKITKEQMELLKKSMGKDPGFLENRPVLINDAHGRYTVYAGNQRVRAARELGMKTIPCIVDKNLNDDVMRERMIRDNLHLGLWDFDILANEFDFDELIDWGFSEAALIDNFTIHTNADIEECKEDKKKKDKKCPNCGEKI